MRERLPSVAFLGLGLIGSPMVKRLIQTGYPVCVWNRTETKCDAFLELGAAKASSIPKAVDQADIIITSLADGSAVTEVLTADSTVDAMKAGAIVIDTSSIPPILASSHAQMLRKSGIQYLDAPVSGGVIGAAQGTLAIMVGGDARTFEAAKPVLQSLGTPVLVGDCGAGQVAKLANQIIVGVTLAAVGEALTFVKSAGADPDRFHEALLGGFADGPIFRNHGRRMIERNWTAGGPMRLQAKDLETAMTMADSLALSLPTTKSVTELFCEGIKDGLAEYDHSAVLLTIERQKFIK